MIMQRLGQDGAGLYENGREILRFHPGEAGADAFAEALATIERLLAGSPPRPAPPRVAVVYREGLFAEAFGDADTELLMVEEDPHDDPPRQLRRQRVAGAPEALDAALARLEGRAATRGTP